MFGSLFSSTKGQRSFASLSQREILALAIASEEEDGRIYRDLAVRVAENFPSTAKVFDGMASEEDEHRRWLIDLYRTKFGEHIPLIRREDVKGFVRPQPLWLAEPIDLQKIWPLAEQIEAQNRRFYQLAAERSSDASIRKLLGDLAAAEQGHAHTARELQATHLTENAKHAESEEERRQFVLQIVQPGLAGLMDGSVSTLAPLFAAAFATHSSHETLLVGLAASVGAGISMGLTEAFSDDGKISGRGSPWLRGAVCGAMTTVGGLGHALPYLLTNFMMATALSMVVVVLELLAIAYIRWKYMDSPFFTTVIQVVLGGILVLLTGILLGSA